MIRKTKIIATIGPATASKEMLSKIIQKGVNVCRLNFSHLEHDVAKEIISNIKEINQELHVHTAILADLQGPKIRVGEFEKPIKLTKGTEVVFSTKSKKNTIYINYQNFAKDVKTKDRVLLDDGKIALEVVSTNKKDTVVLKVVFGGLLQSRKGVNLPNTKISLPCLTKKDKEDLAFVLAEKIEWVGLSFVRSAEDVSILKKVIEKQKLHHKVIAKIEKPEAIKDIDAIIDATDAIMVARGDLGVEVPPHKVPVYQKMIVEKCITQGRPVVIATQMLESMTENPTATRAEVNDVANSVIDGADAMMLSGETSVGKHPLKVIDTMRKIIRDVENSEHNISKNTVDRPLINNNRLLSNAICSNATNIAEQTNAKAIITVTYSGFNTIKTSSFRPNAFIYAFTNNHTILNTLSLVWGVRGFYYDRGTTTDQTIRETKEILKDGNFLKKGDLVVNLASMPAQEKGMTNMMKISKIK
ncbi:MAG: pyruvate kinase [Flavobacteriales bacterium]|jgi:pyruvate kinase|nr:pyruvate kinase [Flavobacteriales bacterium]MDG1349242.1 pyruvate kinase [Flavobacteriales bacterium]|tara:strand:+ start:12920 stop:14335 length:1416 start_codon:yes stop_codon:yes gene_type:complete